MPTYQYRCTECGHDLEAVQKFTDAALTQCPSCGGSLRKIFNAVGVVFKGSGFYRTDSRTAENGKGSPDKVDATSNGSDKPGSEKAGSQESGSEKSGSEKKSEAGKAAGNGDSGSAGSRSSSGSKQPVKASPSTAKTS